MSSLEALLPDDLEKHVQLNRARLNSYGQNINRKIHHTQEETTQWTLVLSAKAKASEDSKDIKDKDGKDRDKSKDSMECWNCGKRAHLSKDCW